MFTQTKMTPLGPLLADNRQVRIYRNDYAPSDTESELEAQFKVCEEDEEQCSTSERLKQNQKYMDEQIKPLSGESSTWVLEPQARQTTEKTDIVLVRKPTASNLLHRNLNPFIYRNIQKVDTLDDLAVLLDTPRDWEQKYNQVVQDGYIIRKLNRFSTLPEDTLEATIKSQFIGLVSAIARDLGVHLASHTETKIIVGGILARYEYDVRSQYDPYFLNAGGVPLIATEVKTHRSFGLGEMWYHSSSGVQVLSAKYSFNCPTFLFTQKQWKLFNE